ncbi:MAG: hypothetical protein ACOZAK_04760 [Patescibacteria group bacterium]
MTKEIIKTENANETTQLQLLLENGVFSLLVIDLLGENELAPITLNENKATAEKMFDQATTIGLFAGANSLRAIMFAKIMNEIHHVAGTTVVPLEEF